MNQDNNAYEEKSLEEKLEGSLNKPIPQIAERINPKNIKKKISRRHFLGSVGVGLVVGGAVGTGANYGLNWGGRKAKELIFNAEKDIRELALDVKVLSGSLEKKLASQAEELRENYENGQLRVYEELGIASPEEIKDFEKILDNLEEFEEHYSFVERTKIFRNRIDEKLLNPDQKLESYQPEVVRGINDKIRGIFGKKTGKKGEKYRESIRDRLKTLCVIYDTNEDNRRAQTEVLKEINKDLKDSKLTPEERGLLTFLKSEYEQGERTNDLEHFIRNYDNIGPREETLLNLRESLTDAEIAYRGIKENKDYVLELQGYLKDGIELKKRIRERSAEEFEAKKNIFVNGMNKINSNVYDTIEELEKKGINIETREEIISKGIYAKTMDNWVDWGVKIGTGIAGTWGGFKTYSFLRRNKKAKVANKSLKEVAGRHNKLAEDYDILADQLGRVENERNNLASQNLGLKESQSKTLKNPDISGEKTNYPEYPSELGGNDYY